MLFLKLKHFRKLLINQVVFIVRPVQKDFWIFSESHIDGHVDIVNLLKLFPALIGRELLFQVCLVVGELRIVLVDGAQKVGFQNCGVHFK